MSDIDDAELVAWVTGLNTGANSVHMSSAGQNKSYPLIVIRRTGGTTPRTTNGKNLWTRTFYEFHVLHSGKRDDGQGGYGAAMAIALQLKAGIHGFRGAIGNVTIMGAVCQSEPVDASEADGDRITRWIQLSFLMVSN